MKKISNKFHPGAQTISFFFGDLFFGMCSSRKYPDPTTEGISLRTPPPPWIFHFCRELMTPHPFGISTSVTKTPQPLWKSSFSQRKTIKVEE